MHNRSTLDGNDVYLSKWYGYGLAAPIAIDCSEMEVNAFDACGSSISTTFYIRGGTELVAGNTIYIDPGTTVPISSMGYFLTSEFETGNRWVSVDNNGVIIQIGNCL